VIPQRVTDPVTRPSPPPAVSDLVAAIRADTDSAIANARQVILAGQEPDCGANVRAIPLDGSGPVPQTIGPVLLSGGSVAPLSVPGGIGWGAGAGIGGQATVGAACYGPDGQGEAATCPGRGGGFGVGPGSLVGGGSSVGGGVFPGFLPAGGGGGLSGGSSDAVGDETVVAFAPGGGTAAPGDWYETGGGAPSDEIGVGGGWAGATPEGSGGMPAETVWPGSVREGTVLVDSTGNVYAMHGTGLTHGTWIGTVDMYGGALPDHSMGPAGTCRIEADGGGYRGVVMSAAPVPPTHTDESYYVRPIPPSLVRGVPACDWGDTTGAGDPAEMPTTLTEQPWGTVMQMAFESYIGGLWACLVCVDTVALPADEYAAAEEMSIIIHQLGDVTAIPDENGWWLHPAIPSLTTRRRCLASTKGAYQSLTWGVCVDVATVGTASVDVVPLTISVDPYLVLTVTLGTPFTISQPSLGPQWVEPTWWRSGYIRSGLLYYEAL